MNAKNNAIFLAALLALVPTVASAGAYDVYVGYSDGLRGAGFFPNPWSGDPGVTFEGSGPPYDAGAIMIRNTSGASLTVNGILVSINGTPVAPPWTFPVTLASGGTLIVTQTTQYDFDTSDIHPITPNGVPVTDCLVTCPTVTVDTGIAQLFKDSTHTLDTLGYDFAFNGSNESFNWRLIGSCAGPGCGGPIPAIPEPETYAMMLAGLGLLRLVARRRK